MPLKPYLDAAALHSLLEVGCGHRGLGTIVTTPFVGAEIAFQAMPQPPMIPIQYGGSRLPFKDGAFHTVLSMDTLEHVPLWQRPAFLRELVRVAACRVIVGFPAGSFAAEGDLYFQMLLPRLGLGSPEWLREHEEHGVPEAAEVEAELERFDGCRWQELPTTGGFANMMVALADMLPDFGRWVRPVLDYCPQELERWVAAGSFGPSTRSVYLLERRRARTPVFNAGDPISIARAAVCPDCDADLNAAAPPSCSGCGRVFALNGPVWQLTPTDSGRTQAEHLVTFYLEPDWLGSNDWIVPVHNFLHAFAASTPCQLWLRVDRSSLTAQEALSLLKPVLAAFGERPFPSLYISDDPVEHPPVESLVDLGSLPLTDWIPAVFHRHMASAVAAAEREAA